MQSAPQPIPPGALLTVPPPVPALPTVSAKVRTRPVRTWNTCRPGRPLFRLRFTNAVPPFVSRNAPFTAAPSISKKVPESPVPFEYPARAELPPRPSTPPLASPVSHWILS